MPLGQKCCLSVCQAFPLSLRSGYSVSVGGAGPEPVHRAQAGHPSHVLLNRKYCTIGTLPQGVANGITLASKKHYPAECACKT